MRIVTRTPLQVLHEKNVFDHSGNTTDNIDGL